MELKMDETCKCKWCGVDTTSLGTKECDNCWEMRHRIDNYPELAEKMLKAAKED
jgi:hypothetical protein